MFIDVTVHIPATLALLESVLKMPTGDEFAHILLRWLHFVAGITWIGMLYFFNLVNVPLQKKMDADTKKKVNPELLLPALWFFRWGALVTVLAGLTYFAMYILKSDITAANNAGASLNIWAVLLVWLSYPIVLFIVEFLIIKKVPALIKDGRVFAIVIFVLVGIVTWGIVSFFTAKFFGSLPEGSSFPSPNKTYSIGVGGAYGLVMLLNVWGIIWPANKRIIGALQGGPPAAPELARQAFIASRTNAWLSLPMLVFMAASSHDWLIFSGR
jgi:uncharacterized membrane protein